MGTILGKGFAQALVHTVKSMSAEGTSAFDFESEAFLQLILMKGNHYTLLHILISVTFAYLLPIKRPHLYAVHLSSI